MDLGVEKTIFYFNSEGRCNIKKTAELALQRARELHIEDIIVFTSNGEGAFLLKDNLADNDNINIYAATFPYKQIFFNKDSEGNDIEFFADTSIPEVRKKIESAGIKLIQGIMPLQDIIIPNAVDVKTQAINYTLTLISGGMRLCIQAILMATDGGYIEPGKTVIAMSADTAIVAKSCISSWLFHPSKGLEINEIICKPSCFNISHSDKSK